jgi:NAD-dependent dihydropyrimidine dehydrogenase PreA subunit
MIPYIIKEKCAAQPDICPPMKKCPQGAVYFTEDENEPVGGRIEIDMDKCDGCGICIDLCCGSCIGSR